MQLHDTAKPQDHPHCILVVDDEEIVLAALRATLVHVGYQVVTASNAVQALALLKVQSFSVIISDQQMPRVTGLELLAQGKQIQPDATRILITAVTSLTTVIDAINQGEIYRFVIKPWLREDLLATVKNAVQRSELIRNNAVLQATTMAMNDKLGKLNLALEEQVGRVAEQNRKLEELNGSLEHNLDRSVELCLRTMQTFYPTLGSQARRVFELCKAMTDGLKLAHEQRRALEIAAWLHDIGLVGVPCELIKRWEQSPLSLDEAERALIHHHPILGEELVNFGHNLREIGPTIRAHHERFDGSGYPDRLAGESIPWLARLLAVAVAYAESNHDGDVTIELIKQGSGTAYDPEAVRVFLRHWPRAVVPREQREVLLSELHPDMIVARGIYAANGMLLIPDGQPLTKTSIEKLLNHNRLTPITQSLLVYC